MTSNDVVPSSPLVTRAIMFAYGSNLDPCQIRVRCPEHRFVSRAELRDHKLVFPRFSKRRKCGVASVAQCPGQVVHGALFELSESDWQNMDDAEGVPRAYQCVPLSVIDQCGKVVPVHTYVATNRNGSHQPSEAYMRLIIDGATHWGLPMAWIDHLKSIACVGSSPPKIRSRL